MTENLTNDLFLRACRRQRVERTPVWIMRQAGRYLPEYRAVREKHDFLTLCRTPELAAEVTIQPIDILDVDAAIIFSDIMVIPEAMGMNLELIESRGPVLDDPIRSAAQVDTLVIPDPAEKLQYALDAISLTKRELNNRVPLIGFAGSPWTLFSYMVEGEGSKNFRNAKAMLFSDPLLAHRLLEKISAAVAEYLAAQIEAGADAVQIFDSWGGNLAPGMFAEFSVNYIANIVERLRRYDVPVIVFALRCSHSLDTLAGTGCDVLGIDWHTRMIAAKSMIGSKVALQGNLDPAMLYAPLDRIREGVRDVLQGFGEGDGHIFNLGHGILPDVPVEHAKALVQFVREESPRYHPASA